MSEINLSGGIRNNLIALQNTTRLINATQERLATGRKVNSAIDNPTNFFTARAFNSRANELSARLDGISNAIQTVKATDIAITGIDKLLDTAKGLAQDARALSVDDTDGRQALATQFNEILRQIDDLAKDASFNGINLLEDGEELVVEFAEKSGSSTLTLTGFDGSASGLGVDDVVAFATNSEIDDAIAEVETAKETLRDESKILASNLGVLTIRQDFLNATINTLKVGADNLVLADTNEETANILSLQTQQALGVSALGISTQAAQSVLRLL